MGLPGWSAQLVRHEAEDLEHDNRGDVRGLLVGGVLCRHQAHHVAADHVEPPHATEKTQDLVDAEEEIGKFEIHGAASHALEALARTRFDYPPRVHLE